MSYVAKTWATNQRCENVRSKFILSVLAAHANKTGYCWPSQGYLAEQTGYSITTIRRALQNLEAADLIRREHRFAKNGARSSDGISLLMESQGAADPPAKLEGAPLPNCEDPPARMEGVTTIESVEEEHTQGGMTAEAVEMAQGELVNFAIVKTSGEHLTSEAPGGGVAYLMKRGTKRSHAWALVNKWRKVVGDDTLLSIMAAAARKNVGVPVEYITKAVQGHRRRSEGKQALSVL